MKPFARSKGALAAIALAATAFVSQAFAAPVISFAPVSQNTVGPTVSVDIIISGLAQSVGGVGMTLGWDSSILTGLSWLSDPTLKMGVAPNDLSGPFGANSLEFFFFADLDAFPTEAALATSEGASFTLASVTFNTAGLGLSALTLSSVSVFDFTGDINLQATADTGSVCVVSALTAAPNGCATTSVPEPTTALLVALALGGLGLSRKRKPD